MPLRILCGAFVTLVLAQAALAGAVDRSLFPVARPGTDAPEIVARAATVLTVAPSQSLRPALRPAALRPAETVSPATQAAFERWIRDFRPRALARGIRGDVFDRAFRGVRYDPEVVRRDKTQSEFTKTLWQYLDSAVSDSRIETGREMLRRHKTLLDGIEARYGVDRQVVVAVWGMETAYGSIRGDKPVIGSMATLAFDGRRRSFFENQLVAALTILQRGDTSPANMTGSWAGAMGHTQFMPTSFEALAVDYTGDGRRDIWGDNPADALASTANYLRKSGWIRGMPWGVEVKLPRGFDYALARRDVQKMPSDWARLGVTDMDGRAVPDHGVASVLVPAGHQGAAFLIFRNYRAIERYNAADAYVIGVGHLSDRLIGRPPIRSGWPRDARALSFAERKELQRRLTARGFATRGVDGRIGPNTVTALRAYQRAAGLVPDGYASLELLQRLR